MKNAIFYVLMLSIPVFFFITLMEGYYAFKKMTFPTQYDGNFGVIDAELGWFHKPSASVRHIHHAPDGSEAFNVPVNTDLSGFRSKEPGSDTPKNAIMFLGDSQTFGFGVTYEQSFPGQVESLLHKPVVIAASPAYGGAQALLLARRWEKTLKPRVLVYFDWGHWKRNACSGRAHPELILKPCFWEAPQTGKIEIVKPPAGLVEHAAKFRLWPGGMLGVGQESWGYFLVSRPVLRIYGYMVRIGLISGFAHDFDAVGVNIPHMQDGIAETLIALQKETGAQLLVIDTGDMFKNKLASSSNHKITYIGKTEWDQNVESRISELPPQERTVPYDNHWSPQSNKIVADFIAKKIHTIQKY